MSIETTDRPAAAAPPPALPETGEQAERRVRRRAVLMVVGVLPALLVLAFAIKVALMLHGNSTGRDAYDRGDEDGAVEAFAGTRALNLLEPWVAPFDEGAAHHALGEYDDAVRAYEVSLQDVPRRQECTVRINLALAHEALGDAAAKDQDPETAAEEYQRGVETLAAGECPTAAGGGQEQRQDAGEVDRRLRGKQQAQEQQQGDQGQGQQQPPQPQDGQDPREDQLQENNQRGQDQRQREQDLYEDQQLGRPNTW